MSSRLGGEAAPFISVHGFYVGGWVNRSWPLEPHNRFAAARDERNDMAVLAALPGFLDWLLGIPNGTPAKRTGLLHMGRRSARVGDRRPAKRTGLLHMGRRPAR